MAADELLTTREVATLLRSGRDFVTTLALRGELRSVKIGTDPGKRGGKRLFPRSEVEKWVTRRLRAE